CNGSSGAIPIMTVELRSTAGGVPTAVLATTTIPGFASPVGVFYYTATFASPATVNSGTMYAIVLRLTANRTTGSYLAIVSNSDVYPTAPGIGSSNSGGVVSTPPHTAPPPRPTA